MTMFPWLKSQRKEFPASATCSIASCCLVCSGLHVRYTEAFNGSHCHVNLWLWYWTRQDRERFYVSSATMVIKTELCQYTEYRIWTQISRVHSPVVKAADCRSAGPWFNSGWRTWFTFVTWYDKLTNLNFLMINMMSPITTSIRTITRKSVKMVAELVNGTALWTVGSIGQRLEGNSEVTKVLHAIALKTTSEFGSYTVEVWCSGSECPHWLEDPQLFECQDGVWPCRPKSNTFNCTRTS